MSYSLFMPRRYHCPVEIPSHWKEIVGEHCGKQIGATVGDICWHHGTCGKCYYCPCHCTCGKLKQVKVQVEVLED